MEQKIRPAINAGLYSTFINLDDDKASIRNLISETSNLRLVRKNEWFRLRTLTISNSFPTRTSMSSFTVFCSHERPPPRKSALAPEWRRDDFHLYFRTGTSGYGADAAYFVLTSYSSKTLLYSSNVQFIMCHNSTFGDEYLSRLSQHFALFS